MKTQKRRLANVLILALALSLLPATALANDQGFKTIVKHFESHYQAKRLRIPLLGLANFVVKVVRPKGVKGFKLAVFEDQDFAPRPGEEEFGAVMRGVLPPEWQPLVRVHSRRDGERTYIYARAEGKDIKVIIVTMEPREAVVLEAKFNPRALLKYLEKPSRMGKSWETASTGTAPEQMARRGR